MPEQEEWCAGIDWASAAHQVCLINTVGAIAGERSFPHDGAGLAAMADWLRTQAGTVDRLHIAIEIPHGPVVESLLEQGFRVYALNPRQLDRFRDRFSVAGAKDDRRDAHVLADAVRTDRKAFRALELADPLVIELREFSRIADDRQQERTRLGNRIREQLWRYYPQMIALSDDMAAEWLLDLWALVPTPEKARRVRPATVARILKRRRIRRLSADDVLERLRAPALTGPRGQSRPPRPTSPWRPAGCDWSTSSFAPPMSNSTDCAPDWRRASRDSPASSATLRSCEPCRASEGSFSPRCSLRHGSS